jgi:hypothetical protein
MAAEEEQESATDEEEGIWPQMRKTIGRACGRKKLATDGGRRLAADEEERNWPQMDTDEHG